MIGAWLLFTPVYFLMVFLNNIEVLSLLTLKGYGIYTIGLVLSHFIVGYLRESGDIINSKKPGTFNTPVIMAISVFLFPIMFIYIARWFILS